MLMQFGTIRAKLVFSAIVSIALLGIGFDEAFAGGPTLNGFVVDDPDNRDIVYSVGDQFNISFDVPTNQAGIATQINILGNFTFDEDPGTIYSGVWTDNQNLRITVLTIGATPTIDLHTVNVLGTTTIGDLNGIASGAAVLTGNYGEFIKSGEAGSQPPTLGITRHGLVLVEEGFSYNGNPVDVHLVNTHYPLVTTNVGEENVAKLVIYSPRGIERLQHVAIGFGLDKNEVFGHSNVVIEWDRLHNGDETITVIDPENYLADVRVETAEGQCRASSNELCLIIEFYHTFRQSLDYNIIGTYIWDDKRSGWQNFYNDGVESLGDSLNPPAKHQASHKGKIIEITESGTNVAYDQEGNLWTFDKSWEMEYQPIGKIDNGITSQGFDRNHVKFSTYKKGQELIAKNILSSVLGGKVIQNNSLVDSIFYESKYLPSSEDIELQNRIDYEKHRANSWYSGHFVVNEEDEYNKYLDIYKKFYEQTP